MQPQSDVFLHFTATGWTAIGSIVGAVSILLLSIFNWFYLKAAKRSAEAAEIQSSAAQRSLELLHDQLALTARPFVAIHTEYGEKMDAYLVFAHNQGNGPALDVSALLTFDETPTRKATYLIGCMPVDAKFQFLIGETSKKLAEATHVDSIATERIPHCRSQSASTCRSRVNVAKQRTG